METVFTARDLGAAVRQRREALGLTQRALADAAGVSRETVLAFEAGKAGVSLGRVFTLLSALHLALHVADAPDGDDSTTLDDVFADLDR
ncbi:helix-turn-helix domain-containing protein [Cryobacterium sp. CG_9.6]|uniref:helix-turn-helix transcriptional regulator n=1 Tax=Cryobacterium sp. CG_9.6 TaxID=2760710 RepID=UPI002476D1F6|nr:helix-turn-helix domain-containing protein [Cryobacterium sp. CG_9.6]MDH6238582.1 y4mF family transcriptional regulator [Cryobacterium sp. CG_9.6]